MAPMDNRRTTTTTTIKDGKIPQTNKSASWKESNNKQVPEDQAMQKIGKAIRMRCETRKGKKKKITALSISMRSSPTTIH